MEDNKIIDLYWERSESAIGETAKKYSRYCHTISYNILHNSEDAEECVNDTYMGAWKSMPPKHPNCLATFLGKITRNLSLDRFKRQTAEKRGSGEAEISLSELDNVIPSASSVEQAIDEKELTELINRFLGKLPKMKRIMFVQRYWYFMPVKEIAEHTKTGESQVKTTLFRVRNELKKYLESEGVLI